MLPRLACRALCPVALLGALAAPAASRWSPSPDARTTLVDGPVTAGEHQARWAASVTPGLYFARLEAPGGTQRVIRMTRFD